MVDATQAADIIRSAHFDGGSVFVIGNGGSAAQASHFAAELVADGYRCFALTDSAVITALANDYDYAAVFSLWLSSVARTGDVVLALTTSGKSKNILDAKMVAALKGLTFIQPPTGENTQAVQEDHLRWLHQVWQSL